MVRCRARHEIYGNIATSFLFSFRRNLKMSNKCQMATPKGCPKYKPFLEQWQTKLSFWIASFIFLYWCLSELSR